MTFFLRYASALTRDGPAAAEFVAPYDASPVSRLRAAGASLVGKANMDEFGMGSAGAHSYFGPTMNAEGAVAANAARVAPCPPNHPIPPPVAQEMG